MIGRQANESVGVPFCRNCPNKNVLIEDQNTRNIISSLSIQDINRFNMGFN